MRHDLLERFFQFREKRFCRFGTSLEVPVKCFADFHLGLRLNSEALHPASRARKGACTSSQE